MNHFLFAPVTDAQRQRDTLLGALVGLARSTVNEPKTEDTDRVLASGLRLAADPNAAEDALRRMYHIVETEKHRVAPNCATCTMRCGNTDNYDLARLWAAPSNAPSRSTTCSQRAPRACQLRAASAGSSAKTVDSWARPCLRRTALPF